MKKSIIKALTTAIIGLALVLSFLLGKSQSKTIEIQSIQTPSYEDYIHCDSFEDYYLDGNELHLFANGHEYIFEH